MVKKIAKITIAFILLVCSCANINKINAEAKTINSLESGKEILYYIFYTNNGVGIDVETQLNTNLGLSRETINTIKNIGLNQHNENDKIKDEYSGKTSVDDVNDFNNKIKEQAKLTMIEMQNLLANDYNKVADLISTYWMSECTLQNIASKSSRSDDNVMVVYATQYIPTGGSNVYEVALPDKYIKFANLGWDTSVYPDPTYTLDIQSYNYGTYVSNVPIDDVGPWNEDDNYWSNNRRIFSDLELSRPEATAAYFDGYNDGLDQFGRIVTNPAGIDLSPAVASQLGFGYLESGFVTIYLNF